MDLHGKNIIITGTNDGIGKETAIGLAKLGATIIMICRNQARSEIAQKEIITHSGNPNVILYIADLVSFQSVKNVATEIKRDYKQIDCLINNAGLFRKNYEVTEHGFEIVFQVNYLSHFLLTNELLPLLKKSGTARIINLTSGIHKYFGIKMDDLMCKKKYRSVQSYSNSKTAIILYTKTLAKKLRDEGTNITVNCVHPGHVHTKIQGTHTSSLYKIFSKLMAHFQKTPQEGALSSIYVASSDELEGISGKYFVDSTITDPHKDMNDKHLQDRLWNKTLNYLKDYL